MEGCEERQQTVRRARALRLGRAAALSAACLTLNSCDLGQIVARLPVIAPNALTLVPGTGVSSSSARITQAGGPLDPALLVTCTLELQQGRRPTDITVLASFSATPFSDDRSRWLCTVPTGQSASIRPNMRGRMIWQVFSPSGSGDPTLLGEAQGPFTLSGCSNRPAALAAMIAAGRAALPPKITLVPPGSPPGTPAPAPTYTVEEIIASGYIPTHGASSFSGMGVAFVRAGGAGAQVVSNITGMAFDTPMVSRPDLLMFRPSGSATNITDGTFDPPYTLIGVAYAQSIPNANAEPLPPTGAPASDDTRSHMPRPSLACIAHDEWFIHARGIHRHDGGFRVTSDAFVNPFEGIGHNAMWDVHIFISANGTPQVARLVSDVGIPVGGLPFDGSAFFFPTAYD
jgi:hypothetical protein